MKQDTTFDAIIIGAGPAGSTAAILLARAGWRIALVERQSFPRRKVCGECIAATNLPLLENLGIGVAFQALAGPPLKQVALICGEHLIHADLPALPDTARPWGRALGREHLDLLLLQQAERAGTTLFQPWTVYAIEGEAGNWRCGLRASSHTETLGIGAPILIAASGSWSHHPARPHRAGDLLAFKANFLNADLPPGLLPVLSFPGGYGGMVVSDTGITTVACCIRRDQLVQCRQQSRGLSAGDAIEAYLKTHCVHVKRMLEGAQRAGNWLATGPIRPGIHLDSSGTEAFAIGNAAGEAHPLIGEGISMAIQSAWLLADMLIEKEGIVLHRTGQKLIRQEYAKRWHQLFARRLHLAAVLAHLAMRPRLAGSLLPLLRRHPSLLTCAAKWCGKISKMTPEDRFIHASG
jgi:flavin-dependent dehydrogenase